MKFNARQRLLLIGVLQDQKRLADLPWNDGGIPRDALGRYRLRIRQAREGMVPIALEDWLGHFPSNSEHVLFHREYARLEGMRLLVRCNPFGGRRTTHLKLTPSGRRTAERLLADEYGLAGGIGETIDWSGVELMPVELPPETDETVNDCP